MSQRVRFAAAASGAAALAYVLYREIRHLATRPQKLAVLGRVEGRFQAASLDQMVRCDAKRLRRMLRALLLGAAPESLRAARKGDGGREIRGPCLYSHLSPCLLYTSPSPRD